MKRRNKFVSGDHLVVCDRSGFIFYRSECKLEWTGKLVAKKYWEPKHPQLEIRSVRDDQSVGEDARVKPDQTVGDTTTSSGASKYAKTVTLSSVANIYDMTSIGIVLDNSQIQWTHATADPVGSDVTISEGLEGDVASGNTVYVGNNGIVNYINLSDSERRALL